MSSDVCPECGAIQEDGITCQDHFHQMLYWENEDPSRGVVHHLLVLGYNLQHPSLYSQEGLQYAKQLLVTFLKEGLSTQAVRRRAGGKVSSSQRKWKVTSTRASTGAYRHPVQWRMRAKDVVAGGAKNYVSNVRVWAQLILEDLEASGNLSP